MKLRIASGLAVAALAVALAGCSSPSSNNPADTGMGYSAPSETPKTTTSEAALATATSDLGEIVVDGKGMTVYMYDKDTKGAGTSTCSGDCAAKWPAVTTDSDSPKVEGVTGDVGTITGADGSTQVTLNGWPLYTFAGDSAAGDTNGQGINSVWWVLSPAGDKIGG